MNGNVTDTKLGQFTREEFADWLWRGLKSFYSSTPSDKNDAFDDFGHIILQQESVCEGLACVYENYVPESKRLLFRQAIGDVLREQGRSNKELINAFSDLIYLIARIDAYESLSAFFPIIGNGPMGKENPDVFFDVFAVLRSLTPSDHAYKTAFDLINSANFDDGYLFEAIKVLIDCKPSKAAQSILFLEPRLSQLRKDVRELESDEWITFCEVANDWVQYVLKLSPISWLKELWEEASHEKDQLWLFRLVFANDHNSPQLNEDESSNTYSIKYGSRKVPLKVSGKDFWTRKNIRRTLICNEFSEWSDNVNDLVNKEIYTSSNKKTLGRAIYDKSIAFCRQPYQPEESCI